jgi:hypothetical protein
MSSPDNLDFNHPENWTNAQPYANALGAIPSSFTTTIRTLIADGNSKPADLSQGGRFLMTRFVKIPGMRAPFYFAALTFHKEQIGTGYISPSDLVKPFKAHEMAAVIGLLYLYRRARKLCDPDEWALLSKTVLESVDIGGHLGLAIPNIGPGLGMLVAGTPLLAQAAFSIKDKKGFKEYRRALKSKGLAFDPGLELARWNTSCVHVAAVLMQSLGIGVQVANAFVKGMGSSSISIETEPEAYKLFIANRWIADLKKSGLAPEMVHKGQYYPLKQDLNHLIDVVETIRAKGSQYSWLEKNKESISPQLTPQLFKAGEKMPIEPPTDDDQVQAQTGKNFDYESLPNEVRELFSREEVEQMSAAEIEDVLKQAKELEDIG